MAPVLVPFTTVLTPDWCAFGGFWTPRNRVLQAFSPRKGAEPAHFFLAAPFQAKNPGNSRVFDECRNLDSATIASNLAVISIQYSCCVATDYCAIAQLPLSPVIVALLK
jgi:hypothetical protein